MNKRRIEAIMCTRTEDDIRETKRIKSATAIINAVSECAKFSESLCKIVEEYAAHIDLFVTRTLEKTMEQLEWVNRSHIMFVKTDEFKATGCVLVGEVRWFRCGQVHINVRYDAQGQPTGTADAVSPNRLRYAVERMLNDGYHCLVKTPVQDSLFIREIMTSSGANRLEYEPARFMQTLNERTVCLVLS